MNENANLSLLIEEAIRLELNAADLYMLFSNNLPEDKEFWWGLVIEEKNHASLLRSAKDICIEIEICPNGLLPKSLQELKSTNDALSELIEKFNKKQPSRAEAFSAAFKLENSAGEIHFQNFMAEEFGEEVEQLFKKLNYDDKDHANRIKKYMKAHNIPMDTE